jgi:hypothetical protein
VLQCPQRDLDGVLRCLAVPASDPVGVLCPQLGDAMTDREILGVLSCVDETRATVAAVGGERLVFVVGYERASRVGIDRLAAFAQLIGDRAALVLGALGGVDDAGDRCMSVDLLRLSV